MDERVAMLVELRAALGLRRHEAVRLRPLTADKGDHVVIRAGTRGRRQPVVSNLDFEASYDPWEDTVVVWGAHLNPGRRRSIDRAKALVTSSGRIVPESYTSARWARWERQVFNKCELSRKGIGFTPDTIRKEWMCARAERLSGLHRPLRRSTPLTLEETLRDVVGRQIAALEAGLVNSHSMDLYHGPRDPHAPQRLYARVKSCLTALCANPLSVWTRTAGRAQGGGDAYR